MNKTAIKNIRFFSLPEVSTPVKITMCYLSAYVTALLTVGLFYLLGNFDVGFLSPNSFAIKLFNYVNMLVS